MKKSTKAIALSLSTGLLLKQTTGPTQSFTRDCAQLRIPHSIQAKSEELRILRSLQEHVRVRKEVGTSWSHIWTTIENTAGIGWSAGLTYKHRMADLIKNERVYLKDLDALDVFTKPFTPLVDLGAFSLRDVRSGKISIEGLKERKVKEIILMEDRDPQFFLNYKSFHVDEVVPLNRHGVIGDDGQREQWTMKDMKILIELLKQEGIGTAIGFWGNDGKTEDNVFLNENRKALTSMIWGSDDVDPLTFVKVGCEEMPFADYVARQYEKLQKDFGISGLFLGDGLMGYRSFLNPHYDEDFSETAYGWEYFYKTVGNAVHSTGGKLYAYDVMGKSFEDAKKTGADYTRILPYLDHLVVQTYGQSAWNDYMPLPGYDLPRDVSALESFPEEYREKLTFSLALGDTVEGWYGFTPSVKQQWKEQKDLTWGSVGVWSNEIMREMLKEE